MSKIAHIHRVILNEKDNYVMYSDTDITTDYVHSYTLGVTETTDWLKRDAGESIEVVTSNHTDEKKFHNRVRRYAKALGYTVEVATYETAWGAVAPRWTLRKNA